jgi:hypothetical protein
MAGLWGSLGMFFSFEARNRNVKCKGVAELRDGKVLWDLTLLCDISHHIDYSNESISGMFRAVSAFEMKLKLFWKQLKNDHLCHFPPVICFQ